jgi:hypothetical protein
LAEDFFIQVRNFATTNKPIRVPNIPAITNLTNNKINKLPNSLILKIPWEIGGANNPIGKGQVIMFFFLPKVWSYRDILYSL